MKPRLVGAPGALDCTAATSAISGDDHERRVIARASRTAASSARW
jgi:hypothetical protein